MNALVGIIIELVLGAVGGGAVGQFVKQMDLGMTGNIVAGAIGGLVGTWIIAYIPGLAGLTGSYVGQAIVALVCGAILAGVVGLIKNSMAKA
jgi:uncharacterized membrane protein YeaQ/YmgE (transglycosylase-associated protein family)